MRGFDDFCERSRRQVPGATVCVFNSSAPNRWLLSCLQRGLLVPHSREWRLKLRGGVQLVHSGEGCAARVAGQHNRRPSSMHDVR